MATRRCGRYFDQPPISGFWLHCHLRKPILKSFLRWAGSKAQLVPQLREFWSSGFERYVEPFCGSATLFFALEPRSALLADMNPELVHTLRALQKSADVVIERLMRYGTDERSYYEVRAISPNILSPNERAARFIYLNALCFNGLYRVNQAGIFNVPFGGGRGKKVLFDPLLIREAGYRLRSAEIDCSDFESIVNRSIRGDFLYLDPPYATASKRVFSEYGKGGFSEKDIERLYKCLSRADERGVKFLLSYADFPEAACFRARWTTEMVEAKRNIAGFAASRRKVTELLISNCR